MNTPYIQIGVIGLSMTQSGALDASYWINEETAKGNVVGCIVATNDQGILTGEKYALIYSPAPKN